MSAAASPSPGVRTAERPMAFTAWEFIRGSLFAYLYWLVLYVPAIALEGVLTAYRDFAAVESGEVSGSYFTPDRGTVQLGDFWTNAYWSVVDAPKTGAGLLLFAGPASLIALLTYGWAIALLVSLALRSLQPRWPHALAQFAVGAAVGALTPLLTLLLLFGGWTSWDRVASTVLEVGWPFMAAFALTTGVAVMLGWITTSDLALRKDRRIREAGVEQQLSPESSIAALNTPESTGLPRRR